MARAKAEASATAQNTFTDPVLLQGEFNISVSGTFAATVTLQRRFGAAGSWLDIETYTAGTQKQAREPEDDVHYRLGVKTGGFTSGQADMRLSQ